MMCVNKYIDKLQKAQEKNDISKIEFRILQFLWKFFGIELPPLRYLPLMYSAVIVFSIVFISVTFIVMLTLGVYYFLNSLEETYSIYSLIKSRYWNIVKYGTIIWIASLWLFKGTNDWDIYENKCWREETKRSINIKTKNFIIFFMTIVFILATTIFTHRFITFSIIIFSTLVVIETITKLFLYMSVKNWKKIALNDIRLYVTEEDSISDINLSSIDKVTLYSLTTEYTYLIKGKKYCSKQIYIDEPRDGVLFKNKNDYIIRQWIEDNKNIKYAYINTKNMNQAILFNDVLSSSIFGKVFIACSAILTIWIANNYVDWIYYFE